jgi:hypothetical protein
VPVDPGRVKRGVGPNRDSWLAVAKGASYTLVIGAGPKPGPGNHYANSAGATRRLLGNLFEFEDLGAKDLKGIAGPVRAWAALRASSAANSQLSTLCRKWTLREFLSRRTRCGATLQNP